eukprot:2383252-Prymnesium_polylepis.1
MKKGVAPPAQTKASGACGVPALLPTFCRRFPHSHYALARPLDPHAARLLQLFLLLALVVVVVVVVVVAVVVAPLQAA